MNLADFQASLAGTTPPPGLSTALEALWYDGQSDWEAAHNALQLVSDPNGAWVHAYLHRKEGDIANAAYWYRRPGRPVATGPLPEEWAAIVRAMLEAPPLR